MAHLENFQLCVYFAGKNIKTDRRNVIRNDNNNNRIYDNNDPNASYPNANDHVNNNNDNYGNDNNEIMIIMTTMITK